MQVKEVLGECLVKMGVADFTAESEYTEEQSALLGRLLGALNVAYREALTNDMPRYKTETVTVKKGVVDIGALSERILYPVSLKTGDCRLRFVTEADGVYADYDGRAELKYAYVPAALTLDGEIADMRLTSSLLSDGALGEYYFENRAFDIAKSFDGDFRAGLSAIKFKGRDLRLKRSWQ